MEGQADTERDQGLLGVDNSAAEGDGNRGRYSMMVRCASQSSLDESSQRRAGGAAGAEVAGGAAGAAGAAGARHAARLLAALARLRRGAALCDVQLAARAAPDAPSAPAVPAHRAVLAAASPYFHAMFTQFDERTQPSVTIQNVEPHALETIIEYVYTPESLDITEDNVQSLLSAASLLQVSGVREACCVFLAGALSPENALGIRAFADLHACADLSLCATRFIENHFVEVLDTEEFLALAPDTLAQLLDSDRITVPNEEVILDAVIRWMQHSAEERQQQLGALLEHVRLPLLAQESLVARAAAEPLASAGLRVKDLVIEALSYHLMRPERPAARAAPAGGGRPGAQGHPRGRGLPAGRGALAARRRAARAPLPRRPGAAARQGLRRGRLQRHAARAQRGRVRRGHGHVGGRPAALRAPLHARRRRHRTRHLRRRRLRRCDGSKFGRGSGHPRGYVAPGGEHVHAPLVRGRGRAGRQAVRRGRLRRSLAPVPAHRGEVRPRGRRVGERGGDGRAALRLRRGRGGGRAVRRGRARRARRAALRGALGGRGLGRGAAHAHGAPQRRRGRAPRPPLRRGRRRRRHQPQHRGGVRPRHGHVVAAAGQHVRGPLVRRRVRGGGRGQRVMSRGGAVALPAAPPAPRAAPRAPRAAPAAAPRARVCQRKRVRQRGGLNRRCARTAALAAAVHPETR